MPEKVIDTHVHVWDIEQLEYPWLKGNTSLLNRTYRLAELEEERQKAGITAGILVQAANSLDDTAHMLRVAESSPWITGVVGWLPLEDPDATARLLEENYKRGSLLVGVRHLIHDEPHAGWLLRDKVLESLGLLAAHGVPYDLVGVEPAHIETALRVAERWPGLRMIFDHLNQPPIAGAQRGNPWERLMKIAAKHPSFYVKISGLGTSAHKGREWTATDLEPCIEFVLHHFGADRCCCGGDWPVSLLAGSYEKTWTAYRTVITKYLDPESQGKILYQNAERFYGLAPASP